MGGDRDGNPFVTPETTRDVVITARLAAINVYFVAVEQLMFELSNWRCNDEMRVCPCCSTPLRIALSSALETLWAPVQLINQLSLIQHQDLNEMRRVDYLQPHRKITVNVQACGLPSYSNKDQLM